MFFSNNLRKHIVCMCVCIPNKIFNWLFAKGLRYPLTQQIITLLGSSLLISKFLPIINLLSMANNSKTLNLILWYVIVTFCKAFSSIYFFKCWNAAIRTLYTTKRFPNQGEFFLQCSFFVGKILWISTYDHNINAVLCNFRYIYLSIVYDITIYKLICFIIQKVIYLFSY